MYEITPKGRRLSASWFLSEMSSSKGATTGGRLGGSGPPKIWTDHPNFLRSCTLQCTKLAIPSVLCSVYNNLDQGIGPPPNFENVVAPLRKTVVVFHGQIFRHTC